MVVQSGFFHMWGGVSQSSFIFFLFPFHLARLLCMHISWRMTRLTRTHTGKERFLHGADSVFLFSQIIAQSVLVASILWRWGVCVWVSKEEGKRSRCRRSFYHRFWGQARPGAITPRHELCFVFCFLRIKYFVSFWAQKIQQNLQFSPYLSLKQNPCFNCRLGYWRMSRDEPYGFKILVCLQPQLGRQIGEMLYVVYGTRARCTLLLGFRDGRNPRLLRSFGLPLNFFSHGLRMDGIHHPAGMAYV